MHNKQVILELQNIFKSFQQGGENYQVLSDINLKLYAGQMIGLIGASGSGKTSLLHIMALILQANKGKIILNEQMIAKTSAINTIRNKEIGFIAQFHHLLPEFNVIENVIMPLLIAGWNKKNALELGLSYLKKMNMHQRAFFKPSQLSGGEQQRTAIIRALINNPSLLLADEPTGNLDYKNTYIVFNEMKQMVKTQKIAALIATHDLDLANKMDGVITLEANELKCY